MPLVVALRPVSNDALDGGAQCRLVEVRELDTPIHQPGHVGVSTGPPNRSIVAESRSSQASTITFGAPSGARDGRCGCQSGSESRKSRATRPFQSLVMTTSLQLDARRLLGTQRIAGRTGNRLPGSPATNQRHLGEAPPFTPP